MQDLDALLKINRLEMDILYDFRGITHWTANLVHCPCRGDVEIVFSEQFYTYPEMEKALMAALLEFDSLTS